MVVKLGEREVGKQGLCNEENGTDNVTVEEHLLYIFLWSHWIDDPRNWMVIYENECSVSENLSQVLDLIFEVKWVCLLSSILTNIVNWSNTHQNCYQKSQNSGHHLQGLSIFYVTKTEINWKESKDSNSQKVWIKASHCIFKSIASTPESVRYTLNQTLSSTYVFEAESTVHIDNKDHNDKVLCLVACNSLSNYANLDLLSHIKWTSLMVEIFEVCLSLDNRRGICQLTV